jgi:hypothetical protein
MTKNYLVSALLIVMLVTFCAQPLAAQSGRGRQLSMAEKLRNQIPATPLGPEEDARPATAGIDENRFSLSAVKPKNTNSRLIYRDNGQDHHPNRADKKAGWILLGFLAFFIGGEIANGGEF